MIVLGISPLDKDSTASIVRDGKVLFAAGEERFSRAKQHAGFPARAIAAALRATGLTPSDIEVVAYPFLDHIQETALIKGCMEEDSRFRSHFQPPAIAALLAEAQSRVPDRTQPIDGLETPNQRKRKGLAKETFYRAAGLDRRVAARVTNKLSAAWQRRAEEDHRHWQNELLEGLRQSDIRAPLRRCEHHQSHAANAYHASGFDRALIVTLDGYGSGLAGSVSVGEGGRIERLHGIHFPHSLGSFYEMVTSSLGFRPDRHAGKIVGLAAYGDPRVLSDVLLSRVDRSQPGDMRLFENLNVYLSRHLAAQFPVVDVAAAYQHVLEVLATDYVRHWLRKTATQNVVLSGGVTANVKLNQRIHEIEGVANIFIYPNMGDGGCGTGLALHLSRTEAANAGISDVYWGPEYSEVEIETALRKAGLTFERPSHLPRHIATKIHEGLVVARFAGRMEYGPRALGNRSILYHGREPKVNQWLNKRLGRTEFMPFAPVTLWEEAPHCYQNLSGARYTAEFMTITFDCTKFMKDTCPAAVHVDGTARPQLIRKEVNEPYHAILAEHYALSGSPSLINTSFNMHEEPIVCSPDDAIRAFLDGRIDALAIGPYFVENPLNAAKNR